MNKLEVLTTTVISVGMIWMVCIQTLQETGEMIGYILGSMAVAYFLFKLMNRGCEKCDPCGCCQEEEKSR